MKVNPIISATVLFIVCLCIGLAMVNAYIGYHDTAQETDRAIKASNCSTFGGDCE